MVTRRHVNSMPTLYILDISIWVGFTSISRLVISDEIHAEYNLMLEKRNYHEVLCKLSQTSLPISLNPTRKYHFILSLSKKQWWNTIINFWKTAPGMWTSANTHFKECSIAMHHFTSSFTSKVWQSKSSCFSLLASFKIHQTDLTSV